MSVTVSSVLMPLQQHFLPNLLLYQRDNRAHGLKITEARPISPKQVTSPLNVFTVISE
ncbi:uncharacterized protein CANTADRAFT_25996 [Suhomyces tanzawaensis NRRL Y-17324]|uniref:Uncharacterized protein n=1 Tax=Suhomyces tanzawaensis NRRL Y-17324 TaxID=984487 RepID=A0A1E4SLP1_9ASCO|nr:uncharacterized protein CANTADRAFT_25996 [Suhomyces tanzawaensis NRRL Y-17324]ODV80430.1 hypothetical protein CANTADRAFT_25996 [Suhomyces tanzawaensis NRRL Y-17324]